MGNKKNLKAIVTTKKTVSTSSVSAPSIGEVKTVNKKTA